MIQTHRLAFVLLALPAAAQQQDPDPLLLGTGRHTYRWTPGWGQLPDGRGLGNTHGAMVVDSKGRIFANTDSERAVVRFTPDGTFAGAWGKGFAGGLHGMCIRTERLVEKGEEVQREFLYLAHTDRHQVVKTTLDGEVLWTLDYPEEAGIYERAEQFKPTAVAVAPDGRLFVADGYGLSWVHVFDSDRNYLESFGGRGTEKDKMRTPHGLTIDSRSGTPELLVCDRENHRLKWYSLDGDLLRILDHDLRRPCNAAISGQDLIVADLAGRVTVFDDEGTLLCHLGENPDPKKWANNGVPVDQWQDGHFLAPHGVCVDGQGDVYVLDWNRHGRLVRLEKAGPGK